jgi:hypothetical protein
VVVIPGHLVVTECAETGAAAGGDGLPQRSAARAALYRGTADASVEPAPGPQAPQPGWWTRQKVSGKHAGGAAQERSADGGAPSDGGGSWPDGVNRGR